MKLTEAFEELGSEFSKVAKARTIECGITWNDGIKYIFASIKKEPFLMPKNIGNSNDSAQDVVKKWVDKYINGFNHRISQRSSNLPGTIADPIIDKIINARLIHLDEKSTIAIRYAHRLSMSAENILGLLLEEYLSIGLQPKGWYCAWGETVRSVDFCSSKGKLLQIKNRSNSENSSSSRVREGTEIDKWHRIDALSGRTNWEKLNNYIGGCRLSEAGFIKFVRRMLSENPGALAIEPDSPWQH